MKVVAYIGSVLLATALMVGAMLILIFTASEHDRALAFLAPIGPIFFIYGPVTLGSLSAYWDATISPDSRRFFRRRTIGVAIADAVGAAVLVVYCVLAGVPIWVPVLFTAVAAGLLALAIVVGRALMRHERNHPRPPWEPLTRQEIVRKVVIVVATFVVTLIVGLIAFTILDHVRSARDVWVVPVFSIEFAAIAATFACLIVTLPLNRRLRALAGGDIGRARTFGKVVLRRKKVDIDPADLPALAQYAALASIALVFQLSWISLLYVGLLLGQVVQLTSERHSAFTPWLTVLLVALLLWIVPLMIVYIRRARRYAREHADLLTAEAPAPAPVVE